jgi:hypothetical protein
MTRARDVADTQDNLGGAVAPFVAGKNKVINGDFGVWQRGTSKVLTSGDTYLADRWRTGMSAISSGTITVSQQTFTPGTAPVAGYESAYFWRIAGASTPTGLSYLATDQPIEDIRTLAGQTVTFSFWAKSDVNRNVDIGFVQYFGVGGSATLQPTIGTVAVTTSWSRLSITYVVPSIVGKTIGPNSCGVFRVYHPQNVNFTFDMWGVQMEAGPVATPFTTASGSVGGELALCQRYYWRYTAATANGSYMPFGMGHAVDANNARFMFQYPVSARGNPTLTFTAASTFQKSYGTSFTSIATAENGRNSASVDVVKIGEFAANQAVLVSAAGNQTAYIEMSAEL